MDFSQPYGANLIPKMESKSGFGGTKRRRETTVVSSGRSGLALSKRITRLAKSLKATNPLHVAWAPLNNTTISTTNAITTITGIAEGDSFSNRFGTQVSLKRFRLLIVIEPGASQVTPATYRITVFRAQSGSTLAQTVVDVNTTSAVIANNRMTRVLFDRLYSTASTPATVGFPTAHNISLSLNNFKQHYVGPNVGDVTGETYFLSIISNVAAGATAPVIQSGFFETWFQP